jgi:3-oxoacyl-[acyl-carrier-protein] synthase I
MPSVAITAGGLVTALGFNTATSCAAIRSGVRNINEANLFDPATSVPVPCGRVNLPQWWESTEKLAELVAPAIHECLCQVDPADVRDVPILLGVAGPDRPHVFEGLDDRLLEWIEYRLKLPHHPLSVVAGRAQVSAALAIRRAAVLVEQKKVPACIVACVDSFLRQNVVAAFAERRRLMTPDNSNGFFPGEAGAAVLIAGLDQCKGSCLEVLGLGFGRESGTIESTVPCRGEGLTRAIREAVTEAGIDFGTIAFRVTDLNGEHYKFKEAMIAVARMEKRPHHEPFELWHPIEFVGEIGAAIGPAALALALTASAKGYAPGDVALFHFSNDDGERAAIVTRYHG